MRQGPRITVVAYSIRVLNRRIVMSYAIVGFGSVDQALARAFARKNIEVVVANAFPGARLVKGFNHLAAGTLAADPNVRGGRRVVFLSSDDEGAAAPVAALP